jgi:spore maturation protein CgeB
MRIFYAASATPNADSIEASRLWEGNLLLSLQDMGAEIIPFDYDLTPHFRHLDPSNCQHLVFIEENRPLLERALLEQVTRAHEEEPIDVFFSYFYSACATAETISKIGSMGIVTVNWYCNAAHQFHLIEDLAPAYDYCLVPEKARLEDYRRIDANPIYCQEAANPMIYRPFNIPQEFDVTFVGQAYGDRPACIRHLLDAGIDARVWGPGWHKYTDGLGFLYVSTRAAILSAVAALPRRLGAALRGRLKSGYCNLPQSASGTSVRVISDKSRIPASQVGGILSDGEMIRMYSRSKINLGFSTCGSTLGNEERILQIRLRDFEVPMSGGFYMVEYMEELEEFYEIGKEIVCYTSPEDLADKIKYYLTHDTEREAIRQAGHRRAVAEHSWHKRFENVFHEIGFIE